MISATPNPGLYELKAGLDDYGEPKLVIFGPPRPDEDWMWVGRLELRNHFRLIKAVEADSWLHAKDLLGFDMTPLQVKLLTGTAKPYETFGKTLNDPFVRLYRGR